MARKHNCVDGAQRGAATLRTLLLLFTGTLLVLVLIAALMTSLSYFRDYVSEQLSSHARDGATAVGLSLSNAIDGRDPVAAASLIDAAFDSSSYLSVRYLNLHGDEVAGRSEPSRADRVPAWFRSLAYLEVPPAKAEVMRGWSRLGTVEVISDPGRAYQDLWRITVGLIVSTLCIGGVGLVVLYFFLRRTLRPLAALEEQAEALRKRDFRQRVDIRSTRELNQVTAAMNQMSDDLGQLFDGQAKLIQHLRRVSNEDPITGLASRSAFDQRLKVEVESEERAAPGVLMLVQLHDFADYNHNYGRSEGDRLLLRVAGVVNEFLAAHVGSFAGRRNGSEFAIYVPGVPAADAGVWCRELVQALDGVYADSASALETAVHAGLARTQVGRGVQDLLAAADEALRQAQDRQESNCQLADPERDNHYNLETWRGIISDSIQKEGLSLWLQPMISEWQSTPLYHQVFSRMDSPEGALKAGMFVPMAERFGLIVDIDRLLVRRVLARLQDDPHQSLAFSLSSTTVANDQSREEILAMLAAAGRHAGSLWVGVAEQTIHHHRVEVGMLVKALTRLGISVLVDRFGVGGVPFSYLRNLRFQALRIDNSFIHGVDCHDDNRFYLESVLAIAHSQGLKVFATGVETAAEYSTLCELGIDGAMGYHLGRPFAADNQSTGD